jgi:hypothetical protein
MRATRSLVPAALAVVLLSACSTTTSRVTGLAPAAGQSSRPADRALWLSLDGGLRAALRATDASAPGEAAPAFRLEIEFQPKVLGYSFDAAQVELRDGRGGAWRPIGQPGGYQPLVGGARLTVQFERPVKDGEGLELVIAGAALGSRRLEPVTVALSRTDRTSHRAAPGVVDMGKAAGKTLGTILSLMLAASGGGI